MRHARRFVTLVVAKFGWRLWRLASSCANSPWLRIVEVFHLSIAVVVEWIQLRDAAVRGVPVLLE